MSRSRTIIALVGMSLVAGSMSTAAFAAKKHTGKSMEAEVAQMIREMDKDKNGVVSRDEFMQYMGRTFDRLDINRSGSLERNELRQMAVPGWIHDREAGGNL
jgi:Ca2+-binding EF-hand superfamily protein